MSLDLLSDLPDEQAREESRAEADTPRPRMGREPALCFVVPAHNAAETLDSCLRSIAAAARGGDHLIVVFDGQPTEAEKKIALAYGAQVIQLPENRGPSSARNAGVAATDAEIIFLVDSDVVLDPQAPARALALLDEHGCDAVVGAYSPTTPVPGLFTRLKNLQHSYVHRVNAGRVGTFWAGCSAIRREALLGVEGFDEDLRYCEDIALGHKLARAGRTIRLDPSVSATHLKPYTLYSWMKSDLYGRAVPWSRLILSGRAHPGELNTKWRGVVEGLASLLFLASPLLTLLFGKFFLWGLVCAAALLVLLNLQFIGYAYRHATLGTALMLVPYLVLHYLIAFCGLTIGLFRRRLPVNNGV